MFLSFAVERSVLLVRGTSFRQKGRFLVGWSRGAFFLVYQWRDVGWFFFDDGFDADDLPAAKKFRAKVRRHV